MVVVVEVVVEVIVVVMVVIHAFRRKRGRQILEAS